jgi:hypothetical protein
MLQKPLSLFITKPKGKRRNKLNNNKTTGPIFMQGPNPKEIYKEAKVLLFV